MPRAEARDVKADPRDTSSTSTSGGVLHQIVANLMARLDSSPLMRRAPAQSTPTEQEQLIAQLSALVELRDSLAALAGVPDLDLHTVEEIWPELAALLAPTPSRPARRPTGAQGSMIAAQPANSHQPPPAAQPAPAVAIPRDEDVAFAAPRARGHAVTGMPIAETAPATSQNNGHGTGSRDLGEAMRGVLRTDTRPWSASRIAARLQEIDPLATRQEVYDTLYHRADLFRKTGHGWELTAR